MRALRPLFERVIVCGDLAGNPEAVHERVVRRKAKRRRKCMEMFDLASSNVRRPERGTASPQGNVWL